MMGGSGGYLPNGENATGLSKTSLLSDTADPLLEDGRDLGRGSLGLTSVVADLVNEGSSGTGLLCCNRRDVSDVFVEADCRHISCPARPPVAPPPTTPTAPTLSDTTQLMSVTIEVGRPNCRREDVK